MQLQWLIFRKVFSLCPIFTSKHLKVRRYASTIHILLLAIESFFFFFSCAEPVTSNAHEMVLIGLVFAWQQVLCLWLTCKNAMLSIAISLKGEKKKKKQNKKWLTASWINTQNTHFSIILNCAVKTVLTSLLTIRKIHLMLVCTKDSLPLYFSCLKLTF